MCLAYSLRLEDKDRTLARDTKFQDARVFTLRIRHRWLMSKSEANFVYPKNVRFQCTRCTLCCGDTETRSRHILILRKEAETISETTCKTIKAFAHQTRGHEPYVYEMRKNENGKCVFLEGDACSIYSSRPLICRYYPFELKSQESGKCEFSFTTECQGLASGDVLKEFYFKALFRIARERLG